MPNTLAHFGLQAIAARSVARCADLKWVFLGAVIPDAPWILQRALRTLFPEIGLLDLRLYAIAQSSLAFCLLLSGAFALCTRAPGRVFALLGSASLLHLLLDALQTKWANGVHLIAPASWEMLNFGLFWPEDTATLALTGLGAVYLIWAWRAAPSDLGDLVPPRGRSAAWASLALALYMFGPIPAAPFIERANAHFVGTLRAPSDRIGEEIGLDRARYVAGTRTLFPGTGGAFDAAFADAGMAPEEDAVLSIRGVLSGADRILVTEAHSHDGRARDIGSYLGLAILVIWWVRAGARTLRAQENRKKS